jgi:predicted dehydrogenase
MGRIAVVGAGAFGRFCIDAYRAAGDLSLLAVADPDDRALEAVHAPGAKCVTDWHDVVVMPEVEVVHVATPPWLREEAVTAALLAGKSVFCEKPLALTLEGVDSMVDVAARSGVALGVNYVMRHHPAYHFLYALATSGLFGTMRSISFQNFAQTVPAGHWFWDLRRSGGILVEHGVHFFDAYGHIAGAPATVQADTPRREAVQVTVQYEGGAIGRYYHEFSFPRAVERALGIVFFERGYVEIQGWIPQRLAGEVLAPEAAIREIADTVGVAVTTHEGEATSFSAEWEDRSGSYAACIVAGMRDVIRRHRDPAHPMEVPPQDARSSLQLALAAQRAIATGGTETVNHA